jgi:PAS domain-containing protein
MSPDHTGGTPDTPGDEPSPAALLHDHAALLAFLNASPVGLVQADLNGDVQLINSVTAMLLLPLASTRRMDNLYDLLATVVPDLRDRVDMFMAPTGLVCDGLRLELPQGRHHGAPLQVVSLRVVKLDDDRIMAMFTDISRQVQAERARQAAEQRLQFSLQAAQVGDWAIDPLSGALLRSPLFDSCLGHDTPQPDGHIDDLLAALHPDDRDAAEAGLRSALADGGEWRTECRVRRPDGQLRWLRLQGRVMTLTGQPTRMLGVAVDTTPSHPQSADQA